MSRQTQYPPGWDEARVKKVLDHYEGQSEDEALLEDELAYEDQTQTLIVEGKPPALPGRQ